ncbi:MAG: hypothetical protein A4E74_02057 [Syntrophus sp. PtaB.Bin075]|nr:MAG: hypothetical protein A4E74_02057 [Syntrophus sp. PtaB.Bin075]
MMEIKIGLQSCPHFDQKGPLQSKLENPAEHNANGEGSDRLFEIFVKNQDGQDHRDVKDYRCKGRSREMTE